MGVHGETQVGTKFSQAGKSSVTGSAAEVAQANVLQNKIVISLEKTLSNSKLKTYFHFVQTKCVISREALSAHIALVRLYPRMQLNVLLEIVVPSQNMFKLLYVFISVEFEVKLSKFTKIEMYWVISQALRLEGLKRIENSPGKF